jgi:hypothetical protein
VWGYKTPFVTGTVAVFLILLSGCAGPQTRPSYEDGLIRFAVSAPPSAEVYLVVFQKDDTRPTLKERLMVDDRDGLRVASVKLAPGEYHYFFLVNEMTVIDPKAPRKEKDDFGEGNGIFNLEIKNDGTASIY